jgi:hypothetical protein
LSRSSPILRVALELPERNCGRIPIGSDQKKDEFEDRGEHELKGIPGKYRIFAALL